VIDGSTVAEFPTTKLALPHLNKRAEDEKERLEREERERILRASNAGKDCEKDLPHQDTGNGTTAATSKRSSWCVQTNRRVTTVTTWVRTKGPTRRRRGQGGDDK
jgi:hypothetical protein